jgi:hypothetical protein
LLESTCETSMAPHGKYTVWQERAQFFCARHPSSFNAQTQLKL